MLYNIAKQNEYNILSERLAVALSNKLIYTERERSERDYTE